MTTLLKIDQAGLDPGTPGVSRTDGKDDGSLVTLTNTGSGTTTVFKLLWTPLGDDTAEASLAPTGDPKVWTFTPKADRYGTFLVAMLIDGIERERRTLALRTPGGLVIPALNERGDSEATLDDPGNASRVDSNAVDDPDPNLAALPFAAWWRSQHAALMALDALIAPVRITLAHNNGGGAVTHTGYRTIGDALEVEFSSSFASVAIYDIEPTVIDPIDEGPYTLDTVVRYIFRAATGRDSNVQLPALASETDVECHGCGVTAITGGGTAKLFDCSVTANLEASVIELHRCNVFGETLTCNGGFRARDCDFDPAAASTIVVTGGALFERCRFLQGFAFSTPNTLVAFDDCSFGLTPPTITFTDAAGTVEMDARTKFLWDAAGGGVTNGTITVQAPP